MTTRPADMNRVGEVPYRLDAADLRKFPTGESPHALHAEPGTSGGAPHRPRRAGPGRRHSRSEQDRLARLYARQLALRLQKD